jgi:predicted metalloprotease with PDZ domain
MLSSADLHAQTTTRKKSKTSEAASGQASGQVSAASTALPTLKYVLNLNNREGDRFRVKILVSGLKPANATYQFASTAPGTYQVMDIGRYVRSFEAFDAKGKKLEVVRLSVNQFNIVGVSKAAEIRYEIAETWDSVVKENHVYEMCGSSLEQDHALVNGQTVFGYPTGLQAAPIQLRIERPSAWSVGTALDTNAQGEYLASSYDHIVDSPILLGRLTKAATTVKGSAVEVYTYSKTDKISSSQILGAMQEMLTAAGEFMRELPVKRYTFLWHFEDQSIGAWEHSYSSGYVMEEKDYTPEYGNQLKDIAAHEFFHVITPLNIHSEIIERFNFVTPVASEHLWLYEGTTEWASHIMQLRNGLKSLPDYFKEQTQKIFIDRTFYDRSYSLSKISLTSFSPEGQKQYGNIYQRGALVALLLDIRLLELSGGTRGWREVILELAKQYGPSKPFNEKMFMDDVTRMTYPEIGTFFNDYVRNANPLPIKEYCEKIGISYFDTKPTGKDVPEQSVRVMPRDGKLYISDYRASVAASGLQENDEVLSFNGKETTTPRQFVTAFNSSTGTTATIAVKRGDKNLTLTLPMAMKKEERQYVFEVNDNAFRKQIALRETWLKNSK